MFRESWSDWGRKWSGERPLRRELRRWNALTMLATAGLMLSIAALLILIGIGLTQIAAAENHRDLNLFANTWSDLGLFMIGVRVTNRELTRGVSLAVRLKCELTPGFGNETEMRMLPKWQESTHGMADMLSQLRPPIALGPQSTTEGFMVFEFANASPHLTAGRKLELLDHNCGWAVVIDPELGSVHDFM